MLAYATTNISHLDLSENGLDDKESVILSNIILKLPQLQSFNISGSSFTNKGTVLSGCGIVQQQVFLL